MSSHVSPAGLWTTLYAVAVEIWREGAGVGHGTRSLYSNRPFTGVYDLCIKLVKIRRLLATDAVLGPRYRIQPLRLNLLIAIQTNPITSVGDPSQSVTYILEQAGLTIQVQDREIPFSSELNFIKRIRGFLNRNVFAIPES
jgi:hypothetical protein